MRALVHPAMLPVLAAGCVLVLCGTARALPPGDRLVLAPGTVKFEKPNFVVTGVTVDPPGFVKAEMMPAKEILITVPKQASGSGVVMAFGSNRVFAWDVCVGKCPGETDIESAKTACPSLQQDTEDGRTVWTVTVNNAQCLTALQTALAHSTVPARSLRVSLSESAAKAFFQQVLSDIAADKKTAGLSAGYYGATLQLTGKTTVEGLGRALMHAYLHTVGDVTYDDDDLTLTGPHATTENAP